MSSSYSTGARIALDYTGDNLNVEFISKQLIDIKKVCGKNVSLSTHFIFAKSTNWKDVQHADSFFNDVVCVSNINEFINLIKKDLTLKGLDVAKYILSRKTCTHLKLEKLTYLCYAEYLCKTHAKLFSDVIKAYAYGPIVESVYQYYKGNGSAILEDDNVEIDSTLKMPAQSRILFADNGMEKLNSIEVTLVKYGDFTANELVNITHRKQSPWSKTSQSCEITDEIIQKFHCIE